MTRSLHRPGPDLMRKICSMLPRYVPAIAAMLLVAGCTGKNQLDETGGLKITRSLCPAVAVPAYTGDISLFNPELSQDARALDVVATITNVQTSCDQTGSPIKASATFDVVARRTNASGARDVVLPYFVTVVRAGTKIISKQLSSVQVHFDDGKLTGTGRGGGSATVDRQAASLPDSVAERLNRKRKATDADASIDPMSDPRTRAAVSQASFEMLIGFQLTQSELAYNATR